MSGALCLDFLPVRGDLRVAFTHRRERPFLRAAEIKLDAAIKAAQAEPVTPADCTVAVA
jgi:hypothetical protein